MIFFNKKTLILLFLAICFKTESKVNESVVRQYKNQLEAEDRALMNDFLDSFGITLYEWHEFKKTCEKDFQRSEQKVKHDAQARCGKPISDRLKVMIASVINKANIPRSIEIIRDNSPDFADMGTLRSLMLVDETHFNKIHPQEDQAIAKIWHEVMHLYHDDSFIQFCLKDLKNKAISSSSYVNWFNLGWFGDFIKKVRERFNLNKWEITHNKWRLFRERRADMLSGLISPQIANAWVTIWKNYMINYVDCSDGDHPLAAERLAYMTKLRDEMVA